MVRIILESDNNELFSLFNERWYKKLRKGVVKGLEENTKEIMNQYINENPDAFKEMFAETLQTVLKTYTIKDLKQIEEILNMKLKKEGE